MNWDYLVKSSNYARKEIRPEDKNSFEYQRSLSCTNKKIIYDGKNMNNVSLEGRGTLSMSGKFTNGKFILCMNTNTDVENVIPKPSSSIRLKYSSLDLSSYTHLGVLIYIESQGYECFYLHFSLNDGSTHAPVIVPNKWNYIIWDITDISRININSIIITTFLMGTPPEGDPNIHVYIDNIWAGVYPRSNLEGWNTNGKLAYSHSGYLPNLTKRAILSSDTSYDTFDLVNYKTKEVKTLKTKVIGSNLGTFTLCDFSSVTDEGTYTLRMTDDNSICTKPFAISSITYYPSILKSLNFLRLLRCGEYINGVHSPCHLNCRALHPDGRSVPTFGGWHDAGDVSQFEICTAEITSSIFELAEVLPLEFKERALEEAIVGVNWLLRTRFGDGFRALGITYKIWRSNVLSPDNKTVYTSAEEGSFENFLSSYALAKAAKALYYSDTALSDWSKKAAIQDYEHAKREYENDIYTVRWGKPIVSQTLGIASSCACELYKLTNDMKYINEAYSFSTVVMKCQEKGSNDIPMRGFFYEDPLHEYLLTYEHRGHEESPVKGLCALYEIIKDMNDFDETKKKEIKRSLDLYREYILKSLDYTKPYNLIPGHIYHPSKINIDHFTVHKTTTKEDAIKSLEAQIKTGINLSNDWYLRIMPIAVSRKGFHATLLSKTKAVSAIAKVLNDSKLKQICFHQLEWILGCNPFSESTMYGEGYDYQNLYVAFSRQMVGALPVGFKTKGNNDAPYFPDINNAVYKEIWGHTTGKFLSVLADILDKKDN